MKRMKLWLPVLAAVFLFTGCSQEEEEKKFDYYGFALEEDAETEVTVSNDEVSLTLDLLTTNFAFTDKYGNTWHSSPETASTSTGSDAKNAMSNLIVEYSTAQGVTNTYNSYTYSVDKGLYSVEKIENGDEVGFDIHYTIGNINREYIFPQALPEDEMLIYTDQMDEKSVKKYIRQYYRVYDINSLRSTDNKEELLAKYPELAEKKMYVFIQDTPDYIKENIQACFEGVGYTREDYEANVVRYGGTVAKTVAVFNMTLELRLDGDELVATVPFDSIEYTNDYIPIRVDVLPYFAASNKTDEGYMLVPDGCGATINFNNGKIAQSPYNSRVYGWDDAIYRKEIVDDSVSTFGAFGIAYHRTEKVIGGNTTAEDAAGDGTADESAEAETITTNPGYVLCVIEDGETYASVEADVSGRLGDFNYVFASYELLHYIDMDVSAKSDKTVRNFQKELKPEECIAQRYMFGETDSYVDMAESYRDYLIEEVGLAKLENSQLPVVIEAVGAVDTVDQVAGIPTTVALKLTSYSEAQKIIEDLSGEEIEYSFKYDGWFNGGVQNTNANQISLISKLGSRKTLEEMLEAADTRNVDVYLAGTFHYVYRDKWYDSYSIKRDSAKFIGREVAELIPISPIWFGETTEDEYYLTKPSYAMNSVDNFITKIEGYGTSNVAFQDIGYTVSADYNPKKFVTREMSLDMQIEKFREMQENGNGIMTQGGNDYTLPYADVITDMWIDSKMYNIEDESVPFYQIAVHGLVDYTGTALNLSDDYQTALLRSVETGAGLYFTVMDEPVSALADSQYTTYYGAEYELWRDTIVELAVQFKEDFGSINNQYIVDHQNVASGVTMTEYEDGTKVIVNYNYADVTYENETVGARSYIVIGGDK